ncbi:Butyrate kinase [Alkalibacterium sp. AK22]|uniref:butyrate kinase n=1 Tax=Alkalibacterium sp. AK22 TaxID=1229520 RepID=UPI00044BD02B|nr:butyrate kinase [Alkalibacterium sp. AK22]EXJ23236.1 Butyrate kinase [Alkalibacterium sp. AK22]
MRQYILAINPGSTSTKVSLFDGQGNQTAQTIRHTAEELNSFNGVMEQKAFRKELIKGFLKKNQVLQAELQAVVGRGGLLKPIPGGTYLVGKDMLDDLTEERYGTHASNLGAVLAYGMAQEAGVEAYIVDPVVVDEFEDVARISGLKGIERRSVVHALNQKAVARAVLKKDGKNYTDCSVIVAHMGGGSSIAAHRRGKMIDVVNGLDGEGPFTPERTGGLPLHDFAAMILTNGWSLQAVKAKLAGQGGMYSYLQETDLRKIIGKCQSGDKEAKLYLDAMTYQVAKAIGEMATVLEGRVDRIILTGGAAYSTALVDPIIRRVGWIAPVEIMAGEMEMEALFEGVSRVLNGSEAVRHYR